MTTNLVKFLRDLSQNKPLINDYKYMVCSTIPAKYADIPKLENIPGHIPFDLKEIKEYFTHLYDGYFRINVINEYPNDRDCDYCNVNFHGYYYRCNQCDLNMCLLCFAETSEAIALQNGAKNYYKRKNKLDKCHKHGLTQMHDVGVGCNLCNKMITGDYCYGNCKVADFAKKYVCAECHDSNYKDARLYIDAYALDRVNVLPISKRHMQFGSLLDWIPLYRDEEYLSIVLMNLNPDSSNFQKIAMCSIDDHSRMGWFCSQYNLETIINRIKQLQIKFEIKCKKDNNNNNENWYRSSKTPIKKLMKEEDFPIEYG